VATYTSVWLDSVVGRPAARFGPAGGLADGLAGDLVGDVVCGLTGGGGCTGTEIADWPSSGMGAASLPPGEDGAVTGVGRGILGNVTLSRPDEVGSETTRIGMRTATAMPDNATALRYFGDHWGWWRWPRLSRRPKPTRTPEL
jgi:hypothetical protein